MRIGLPAEVKVDEHRVALTPRGVRALLRAGHEVIVQQSAGEGAMFADDSYERAGARLVATPHEAWSADLVVKVKEPQPAEYPFLGSDATLFCYLHLAADERLTHELLERRTTALGYESYTEADHSLPLLAPMSEIAGRLATQVGANALLTHNGGAGVLLGGVPGTGREKVVVLGAGTAGRQAIEIAVGMGADVAVLDVSLPALRRVDLEWGGRVQTLVSTPEEIEKQVLGARLVVGAVLVPGARAPKLVATATIEAMRPGSVLVDIAVDQGGCFEPSRPTTHHEPTFPVGRSLLYAVSNMPGAVPRTATLALTNATLPAFLDLAKDSIPNAIRRDPRLASAVNTCDGSLFAQGVGQAFGLPVSKL